MTKCRYFTSSTRSRLRRCLAKELKGYEPKIVHRQSFSAHLFSALFKYRSRTTRKYRRFFKIQLFRIRCLRAHLLEFMGRLDSHMPRPSHHRLQTYNICVRQRNQSSFWDRVCFMVETGICEHRFTACSKRPTGDAQARPPQAGPKVRACLEPS